MKLTARPSSALWLIAVGFLLLCGVALADGGAHWSYAGDTGPEHWGGLAPEYATCATGARQSPVDIPAGATVSPADIAFAYQPSALAIVNNGHTVQANYDAGSAITVDGVRYDLLQLHFHASSEHALAGRHAPMEAHFVHKSAAGDLAVIGVMLTSGAENPAYAALLQNLPQSAGDSATVAGASLDAGQMLPARRGYYRYAGSLTTPPCTEGVKWFVMADPVELSDAQIAAFTALYPANERPLQALNGRAFGMPATLPNTGGADSYLGAALLGLGLTLMLGGGGLLARGRRAA